jgi:hypothetical protein
MKLKKSSPLKLLSQSQQNFAEMILRWSPFKIVSVSTVLTFWLKIEQFWPFEEISIFNNGGHFGYRTALTDTILKGNHLRIIQTKFDCISIMMSFLTYIMGFFMNFGLLLILIDYAN